MDHSLTLPIPLALSLSKGCPSFPNEREEERQGFDKLSLNGFGCEPGGNVLR